MKSSVIILFLMIYMGSYAQVYVPTETLPIEEYVNLILEPGAAVSNIQYTGGEEQLVYAYDMDVIGFGFPFTECVTISNVFAELIYNPDLVPNGVTNIMTPPAFGGPWTFNDGGVYSDLLNLSNEAMIVLEAENTDGDIITNDEIFDVGVLEFDIIATNDTLSFPFGLAGEEFYISNSCYPTPNSFNYSGCQHHDVFGIFLSGPGITGEFSSPSEFPDGSINVANVPNSDPLLPMTSMSIGDSINSEFFVNYCELSPDTTWDGFCNNYWLNSFTTLFTPEVAVTCGETYHIRIAIGDVFDHWHTFQGLLGVIRGTGNNAYNATASFSLDELSEPISDAYENCNPIFLNVHRAEVSDINFADTLLLAIQGEAIMEVDYSTIPDMIIIPAGESSISIEVDIFNDGLDEGIEVVNIVFTPIQMSDESCSSYLTIDFHDSPEPLVVQDMAIPICDTSLVELDVIVSGGYGLYTYTWFDGSNENSTSVYDPVVDGEYWVIVSDTCGLAPDTAFYSMIAVEALEASIAPDSIAFGCNISIPLSVDAEGGFGELSYSWNSGYPETPDIEYFTSDGPGTMIVLVEDECGSSVSDSVIIYLEDDLVFEYSGQDTIYGGCTGTAIIESNLVGGFDPISIFWATPNGGDFGENIEVPFDGNFSVVVMATDACGQFIMAPIFVLAEAEPLDIDLPDEASVSCLGNLDIGPGIVGGEEPYVFDWSIDGMSFSADSILTEVDFTGLEIVELQVVDDCEQSASATIQILVENSPILITSMDSLVINCSEDIIIQAEAEGGEGSLYFEWFANDALIGEDSFLNQNSDGIAELELIVSDDCGQSSSLTIEVQVESSLLEIDLGSNQNIACNEPVSLNADVVGGNGEVQLLWTVNGELSNNTSSSFEEILEEDSEIVLTAIDDCGVEVTESVFITLEYSPLLGDSLLFEMCEAEDVLIEIIANGGNGVFSYTWPNGQSGPSQQVSLDNTQSFNVMVTDACNQTISIPINIFIYELSAAFSVAEMHPLAYQFDAESNCADCIYEWDFGDGTSLGYGQSITHQYDGANQYMTTLTVGNDFGCFNKSSYTVEPEMILYIPNAFTPDGDGINDVFSVSVINYTDYEIRIYNRWGEIVFYSTDPNKPWIGNSTNGQYFVPDGTYIYDVKVTDSSENPLQKQGSVTIIR